MRISLLYASILLALGLSCSSPTGSGKEGTFSPKSPSTYSIDELDQLYSPLRRDTVILSEGHDEFRAPIKDLFSDEERRAHRTQILEYTWSLNKDSLLTVWYLPLRDSLSVLGKFSYPRDAVF
jgi:lipoprotein